MFCGNKLVFQKSCGFVGFLQNPSQFRCQVNLVRRRKNVGAERGVKIVQHQINQTVLVYFQFIQQRWHKAFFLQHQGGQKMHGVNLASAALYCQLMRFFERFLGFYRKLSVRRHV